MLPSYKELKRTTDDIFKDRSFNSFRVRFIKDNSEKSAYSLTCSCPPTELAFGINNVPIECINKLINFDYKYVRRFSDNIEVAGVFGSKNFISAEYVPFMSDSFSVSSNFKTKFRADRFVPSLGLVLSSEKLNLGLGIDSSEDISYSLTMGSLLSNVGIKGAYSKKSYRLRWRFNTYFGRNTVGAEVDFDSDVEYALRSLSLRGSRYISRNLTICGVVESENGCVDEKFGWMINHKNTRINSFLSFTGRTISTVFRQKVSDMFNFVVSGQLDHTKKNYRLGISLEWFNL